TTTRTYDPLLFEHHTYYLMYHYDSQQNLHSFPTRRSSDLPPLKGPDQLQVAPYSLEGLNANAQFVITSAAKYPEVAYRWGEMMRSEEHTSELQSRENLVCRLLLEKKN